MITKTTSGISISVKPKYNTKLSLLEDNSYVFEYHILMKNILHPKVKLISREWFIYDTLNEPYKVEGLGVIGEQPVLKMTEEHSYTSYCELKSEIGYMEGAYYFLNLENNEKFKVIIPRFQLIYPGKNN